MWSAGDGSAELENSRPADGSGFANSLSWGLRPMSNPELIRDLIAIVGESNVVHKPVDLIVFEYDGLGRPRAADGRRAAPNDGRGLRRGQDGGSARRSRRGAWSGHRVERRRDCRARGHCRSAHAHDRHPGDRRGQFGWPSLSRGSSTSTSRRRRASTASTTRPILPARRRAPSAATWPKIPAVPTAWHTVSTTNHVLGMEVVLADGSLLWYGGKTREAPGYDLRGIMVGSEGTLGIVTKVVVRLLKSPEAVKTLLAVFRTGEDASSAVSGIIGAGIVPAANRDDGRDVHPGGRGVDERRLPGGGRSRVARRGGRASVKRSRRRRRRSSTCAGRTSRWRF